MHAKSIHGKTSTSRKMITVIACGNAAGEYLPPHFVFPGKTKQKLDGYDTGNFDLIFFLGVTPFLT